ncbi:hypothetical protein [Prosthecobacter fluviatilis]|uniref:Uncharacterized protein n=1 Tax=Prosthecobacter fluviatilis TaxID=445931 RepID=A0ABW0KTW8_9BACT
MNHPALPYDAKTWKLAGVVALVLLGVAISLALMERCLQPERGPQERSHEHRERPNRHRSSLPPEVQRQFEEFRKEK